MKKLYSFTLDKEATVDEEIVSQNENNETVKTIKKVKKMVPHNFFLAKPTRSLMNEAGLYYGVELSKGIRAGLLTIIQVEKRNENDGGVFSEIQKKKYQELYRELFDLNEKFQRYKLDKENDKTSEDYKNLINKITEIQSKIQEYENLKMALYDHTAEIRARNMTITWWLLYLAYKEESGKSISFFNGETLEQKFENYDLLNETNDPFIKQIIEKFVYAISFWTMYKSEKQEDFDEMNRLANLVDSKKNIEEEKTKEPVIEEKIKENAVEESAKEITTPPMAAI